MGDVGVEDLAAWCGVLSCGSANATHSGEVRPLRANLEGRAVSAKSSGGPRFEGARRRRGDERATERDRRCEGRGTEAHTPTATERERERCEAAGPREKLVGHVCVCARKGFAVNGLESVAMDKGPGAAEMRQDRERARATMTGAWSGAGRRPWHGWRRDLRRCTDPLALRPTFPATAIRAANHDRMVLPRRGRATATTWTSCQGNLNDHGVYG